MLEQNKHHICFSSQLFSILYSAVCPEILSFTQCDSPLQVFSFVDRQMGASVTRKETLITVKPGYIVRDMGGGSGGWGVEQEPVRFAVCCSG